MLSGENVALSTADFDLLWELATHAGQIMDVFINGMGQNSETALSYILLGTYAAAMAHTGLADVLAKRITLLIPAGKATPAPPVGTVLGPAGINLQEFCTKFNDASRDKMGDVLPVEITIYDDRSFDFVLKTPPAAFLLKKAAGIKSGSSKGEVVATLSKDKLKEIAETKLPDLNAYTVEEAMKIVEGTARNMGIKIEE